MLCSRLARLIRDETGPTTAEYAMMLCLIIVALVGTVRIIGNSNTGFWARDVDRITAATGAGGGSGSPAPGPIP